MNVKYIFIVLDDASRSRVRVDTITSYWSAGPESTRVMTAQGIQFLTLEPLHDFEQSLRNAVRNASSGVPNPGTVTV